MPPKEMTPEQERTAHIAYLLNEMLRELPSTSALLHMSPAEIREREERASQLGDRINSLIARE